MRKERNRRVAALLGIAVMITAVFGAWRLASSRREGSGSGGNTSAVLAVLDISPQLLRPLVDRPFEWTGPVHENVLGAQVEGTSKATGRVSLKWTPDEREAALEIVLHGESLSTTTAAAGPAHIQSHATTPFVARKRILLDANGFRSLPATVEAQAHTTTDGIGSTLPGLRGRIVERVAERRVAEAQPESDRIAADDVRRRVGRAFDRAVDEHLDALNGSLVFPKVFGDALGQEAPVAIHFATTPDWLRVTFTAGHEKPVGQPPIEAADRGAVVAYFNALEIGERLPEVLRTVYRAYGLLHENTATRHAKGDSLGGNLVAGNGLAGVQRRGAWLLAVLAPAAKTDASPPPNEVAGRACGPLCKMDNGR